MKRPAWSFSGGGGGGGAVSSCVCAGGGRGKASMRVVFVRRSDSEGKVESFGEKVTFFFRRRIGEEVVGTESSPFGGGGGGWSASVGESAPENEVEVVEVWENTESTEERMLEEIELEWRVERRVA